MRGAACAASLSLGEDLHDTTAGDIANAAAWLASDESSFVNGHALVVDGGLTGGRMWSEVLQRRSVLEAAMRSVA